MRSGVDNYSFLNDFIHVIQNISLKPASTVANSIDKSVKKYPYLINKKACNLLLDKLPIGINVWLKKESFFWVESCQRIVRTGPQNRSEWFIRETNWSICQLDCLVMKCIDENVHKHWVESFVVVEKHWYFLLQLVPVNAEITSCSC